MDRQKEEPGSIGHLRLSSETELASNDKAMPAVKETPLRESQTGNRMAASQASCILFSNDRIPTMDATRVSAMKGSSLDCPSLPHSQSPSSSPANNHLVYVRRRPETEAGKSSNIDSGRFTLDHQSSSPEDPKLVTQITEPTSPLLSNLAPIASSSGKHSTSGHGMSNSESASLETDNRRGGVASSIKRMKVSHWEERFHHLQQLLQTLNQSDRKDYLQMLGSLSSAELSRHAVGLEKRSIELSLEEAKEMHRVGMLNVLGTSDSRSGAEILI